MENIKDKMVELLKFAKQDMEEMRGEKMTVQDFDFWLTGFINGYTLDKDITEEQAKEISDYIVVSDVAKEIGVTGTLKESIRELNL